MLVWKLSGRQVYFGTLSIYTDIEIILYVGHDKSVPYTVSFYNLEDKQKARTKPSMYPINIQIGEPKRAFIKNLAAYGFLKIGFKVLKQV